MTRTSKGLRGEFLFKGIPLRSVGFEECREVAQHSPVKQFVPPVECRGVIGTRWRGTGIRHPGIDPYRLEDAGARGRCSGHEVGGSIGAQV